MVKINGYNANIIIHSPPVGTDKSTDILGNRLAVS